MATQFERVSAINEKARQMRIHAILMASGQSNRGAHLGPGMSITDIVATLYFGDVLRYDAGNPEWPDRDRFILSKGHGVLGLYPALSLAGYFPPSLLAAFDTDHTPLAGHPSANIKLGIEASTGSLGHGLSIGLGMAMGGRMDDKSFTTYVLLGDGECNEGSVWEAVMLSAQCQADNLVAIVDHNKFQADGMSKNIINMTPMADKWRSFQWNVLECDGHDAGSLLDALHEKHRRRGKPTVIIAHTTKGKGVSFFENDNRWHHYRGFSAEDAARALDELGYLEEGAK